MCLHWILLPAFKAANVRRRGPRRSCPGLSLRGLTAPTSVGAPRTPLSNGQMDK